MASFNSFILAFFVVLSFSSINDGPAARHLLQLPPLPRATLPPLPSLPNLPQPTIPTLPTTPPSLPKPGALPSLPTMPTLPTLPPLPSMPSISPHNHNYDPIHPILLPTTRKNQPLKQKNNAPFKLPHRASTDRFYCLFLYIKRLPFFCFISFALLFCYMRK
ncbi:hypothetical protein DITRI_Ditri08aG0089000 [Diplodiscus trichospermus]